MVEALSINPPALRYLLSEDVSRPTGLSCHLLDRDDLGIMISFVKQLSQREISDAGLVLL
jgi:hypothetical protein